MVALIIIIGIVLLLAVIVGFMISLMSVDAEPEYRRSNEIVNPNQANPWSEDERQNP